MRKLSLFIALVFGLTLPLLASLSSTRSIDADQIKTSDRTKTYTLPATSDRLAGLSLSNGGTNKSMSAVAGGLVWTDADSQEVGAAGTSGQAAISGGTGAPTWFAPTSGNVIIATTGGALASEATLALSRGGTNANLTPIDGGILYTNSTTTALTSAGSSGQVLQSNGSGAPTWVTRLSGQWSPAATNLSNLGSSSGGAGQYFQFGSMVMFAFTINMSATAANTTVTAHISIPVASTFTLSTDASGAGANGDGSVNGCAATLAARTASADLLVTFRPDTTGSQLYSFSGVYVVK